MSRVGPRRPFARLEWDRAGPPTPEPAELQILGATAPVERAEGPAENRLILGDNLAVMAALLPEFEGRFGLIYADPPFFSGKRYRARVGAGEDSRSPGTWSTVEGFEDSWPGGGPYLDMLHARLSLMHRLLAPTGTLYLHLDSHASAYARLLLDEVFGPERFLNEIVWLYHGPSPIRTAFKRKHDTILVYTKSARYTFNPDAVRIAYDPATIRTFASSPRAGFGKKPDLDRGKVPEDWWYFPVVARLHKERTGFPTQKPEALLERILLASSQPGEWVGDFFCGSGTTPAVASRLGRRWVACDRAPIAVLTSYRRLLLQPSTPSLGLWSPDEWPGKPLKPVIEIDIEGPLASVRLADLRGAERGPEPFPGRVTLWEVDWEAQAGRFRSQSHAVRRWQSRELELVAEHAYRTPGERRVVVRAFDNSGRMGVAEAEVRIHA
jgi:DNA modification methylase